MASPPEDLQAQIDELRARIDLLDPAGAAASVLPAPTAAGDLLTLVVADPLAPDVLTPAWATITPPAGSLPISLTDATGTYEITAGSGIMEITATNTATGRTAHMLFDVSGPLPDFDFDVYDDFNLDVGNDFNPTAQNDMNLLAVNDLNLDGEARVRIGTGPGTEDVFICKVGGKLGLFGAAAIAQPAAVTPPAGGVVIDAQARTAIGTIINILSAAGGGYGLTT